MTDVNDILARLGAIDCCALSDALDSLGLAGAATGLPQRSGAARIAGVAVTFEVGPGEPQAGLPRHLGTAAIEASDSNSIIVVEQSSGVEAGCWGGLLTRGAMARQVRGVVADGPVRDIDEARALEFPVFARSTTSFTARGRVVERSMGAPVSIGGCTVRTGDYVIADNSAVIFITPVDIDRVLEKAESIVAKEQAMIRAIEGGTPIGDVMGGTYEHMLAEPAR